MIFPKFPNLSRFGSSDGHGDRSPVTHLNRSPTPKLREGQQNHEKHTRLLAGVQGF